MAILRYSLLLVLGLGCLGCGPSEPKGPPRTNRVSLTELVRTYRTTPASRRYDGLVIQVFVPSGWRREGEYVEAYHLFSHRSGCVRFECEARVLNPTSDLVVTGLCKGRIHDGRNRGGGVNWYILVDDCRVTEIVKVE